MPADMQNDSIYNININNLVFSKTIGDGHPFMNIDYFGNPILLVDFAAVTTYKSQVKFHNSEFIDHNQTLPGSAFKSMYSDVTISNSSFNNNYSDVKGAAILAKNSTLKVSGSTFENNEGSMSTGGAIETVSSSAIITHSNFKNNSAMYGSAIGFDKNHYSLIENCYFTNSNSESRSIISTYASNAIIRNNIIANSYAYYSYYTPTNQPLECIIY
jgi:predicted outer membrane repeat protein